MTRRTIGTFEGSDVEEVTLRSAAGAKATVMTWGAVLRDLVVPTPKGPQRVVLGFPDFESYPAHSPYFGGNAGRYANRIGHGRFTLDGRQYQLGLNQAGRHHLHGGATGMGKRLWTILAHDEASVSLAIRLPEGHEGYPGNIAITCTYRLEEPATLTVDYTAVTDAPTLVNLAHHSYFNLDGSPDIGAHTLVVTADFYTPVDADSITTGEVLSVAGTPFDFRKAKPVRHEEGGKRFLYDHNFVLARPRGGLAHAATLASERSGLSMQVWTTEPGIQFYDGWKLNLSVPGLAGAPYAAHAGLCLEPQIFPDSPNKPHFPNPVLRPGEVYRQRTEYRFS